MCILYIVYNLHYQSPRLSLVYMESKCHLCCMHIECNSLAPHEEEEEKETNEIPTTFLFILALTFSVISARSRVCKSCAIVVKWITILVLNRVPLFFGFSNLKWRNSWLKPLLVARKCSGHILQEPQAEEHRPTVKGKQHCAYKNSEIQKPMKIARNWFHCMLSFEFGLFHFAASKTKQTTKNSINACKSDL